MYLTFIDEPKNGKSPEFDYGDDGMENWSIDQSIKKRLFLGFAGGGSTHARI